MDTKLSLPDSFVRTIVDLHKDAGLLWLQRLPALLAECEQRWSIAILPPFSNLSYNFVAPAVRNDGAAVVLKAGVPNPGLLTEIRALQLYAGQGCAQALAADEEQGLLLLERLTPGTLLAQLEADEQATAIAGQVMRRLWRSVEEKQLFPSVQDWAKGLQRLRAAFDGGAGPFPERLVSGAETLFAELTRSAAEPVLLHGDLHHYNIIAAQREPWLAIDPKGLVGEPAYEIGALLRNRLEGASDLQRLLARRVDQLAEMLGLDRQRVLGWGMAQAVLSAWWSYEDHGHGGQAALEVADALAGLLR